MPIDYPTNRPQPSVSRIPSDFVRCQNLVFRPADVDGFSHQVLPESDAVTVVNFKGYTQTLTDPDRRLFDFLEKTFAPAVRDEAD